jgi:hypothetical protein
MPVTFWGVERRRREPVNAQEIESDVAEELRRPQTDVS